MTTFGVPGLPLTLHLPAQGERIVAAALDEYAADPGTAPLTAAAVSELRRRVLDPNVSMLPLGPDDAELLADAFNHAVAAQ